MRITDGRDIAVISPVPPLPIIDSDVPGQRETRARNRLQSLPFPRETALPPSRMAFTCPDEMSIFHSRNRCTQHRRQALPCRPEPGQATDGKGDDQTRERGGVDAQYFLADAWFGTKPIIKTAEDALLVAIVRMKKNKMKYRFSQLAGARSFATTWMSIPFSSRPSAANE